MDRRGKLTLTVSAMAVSGLGFALMPFIASMQVTDAIKDERVFVIDLNEIPLGEYRIYRWKGKPIAIFRPDQDSIDYLISMNSVASGADYERDDFPSFFAYERISTYRRCILWDSVKEGFMTDHKGWYDPCHMGFWDYSGRYLPGFNAPSDVSLPDLKVVAGYRVLAGTKIELRP